MGDARVLPQPIGDRGPCNVKDHEVNQRGDKIVFSDEWSLPDLNVDLYVVSVDDDGELVRGVGGVSVAVEPVDTDGGCMRIGVGDEWPDFPNGAEWSRVADEGAWLYYSSLGAGRTGPVRIRRKERSASGLWERPSDGGVQRSLRMVFADDDHFDRYLVNCWESDVMTERVLLYVKQAPGVPARSIEPEDPVARRCWAVDRRDDQPTFDHVIGAATPTSAIQSAPARPVPQLPAVLTTDPDPASPTDDPALVLQWRLLFQNEENAGRPLATSTVDVELHRYPNVVSRGLTLVSVGCRRYPTADTAAARAWVVYAIWQGQPGDGETGSFDRPCWIDAFEVTWRGPYGGPVPSLPPDPGHLAVTERTRIVPRLGDDAAFRFILDDENYKDPVDQLPYVSVAVGRQGHSNTNDVQPTVLHAVCIAPIPPPPVNIAPPGSSPLFVEPERHGRLVLMEPIRELQTSSDDRRIRLDPEVIVAGQAPYVYYSVLGDVVAGQLEARFWRAEARP